MKPTNVQRTYNAEVSVRPTRGCYVMERGSGPAVASAVTCGGASQAARCQSRPSKVGRQKYSPGSGGECRVRLVLHTSSHVRRG